MKIIHFNAKKGEIKLNIQTLDDLWYLSNIIEPGDKVQGKTLRKIKTQSSEEKSKNAAKRPVFIAIEVEKVEFGKYSNALRVLGVIKEAPEDIPLGDHHTFNLEENSVITIIKEEWLKYQLDKLKEASSEEKSAILIIVHDREEAYFALFKKYGYEILVHIEGDVQKKREENVNKGNFYASVINKMKEYAERYNIKQVILASPAFWKEDLIKEIKEPELKKMIITATCSSATKNGIEEVIKRPEVKEALKQERAAKEMIKVEELFAEVAKNNLAAYGVEETEKAATMGAVKDLLVTDSFIQKSRQENFYKRIEGIMKMADKTKSDIDIVSSEHDGGKKLDGLGGIGAILRFKMSY